MCSGWAPQAKPIGTQQYPELRDWLRGGHVTQAGPILESLRTAAAAAGTVGWWVGAFTWICHWGGETGWSRCVTPGGGWVGGQKKDPQKSTEPRN